MATSGTTAFNIDLLDVIEEAYELCGVNVSKGYSLKTARRSIDLLMREWGNRGINFWTVKQSSAAFLAGALTATLDSDTIDILDCVWRTGTGTAQQDRTLTRMPVNEYAHIANKNQTGMPGRFWVNRLLAPIVYVWPVPVDAGTLIYWKLRRIEDTGAYTNNMDLPARFLPALTTGLAYYLSMKTPEAFGRSQELMVEYEKQYALAAEEDRDRASIRLVPDIGYI